MLANKSLQPVLLLRSSHWSIALEHEHLSKCLVPDRYEASLISSCSLHFSFCGRTVPKDVCRGHVNSTVCQEVVTTDGLRHYFNVGDNHGHRENGVLKPTGMCICDLLWEKGPLGIFEFLAWIDSCLCRKQWDKFEKRILITSQVMTIFMN